METSNLKIGTILKSPTQEYRIDQVLGAGAFGITYLATSKVKYGNVSFNVKFAIKEHFMETCFRDENGVFVHCTPTSRKNVELSRKDFLNEAKRLKEICQYSKNIVHVNEAFEANGTAYYVMEYLDGGSPKLMDEKKAISLITQIAEAVQILHDHRLLHLDIKPDNIVLKKDEDGTYYPVLIDFGITKHFDEKGRPTSSPNAKGISLGYAPIEQNDVIREFSPTLDIYALGATFLYLLTGKNPPSSVKLIDEAQKELKRLIPSSASVSTTNTILNAMKPNKNGRTQTIESFLKDIKPECCKDKNNVKKENSEQSHTEPIKQKNSSHTEPLTKKEHNRGTSIAVISNASYWIMFTTILSSLWGLWSVDCRLFMIGLWCILGLSADIFVCVLLNKLTKVNLSTIFLSSLFVFIAICYFIQQFTPIYVILIEIILLSIILVSITSNKNVVRWIVSIVFLATSAFFGYIWYSYNILHPNI